MSTKQPATPDPTQSPRWFDFPQPVLLIAIASFLIHWFFASQYGFHRDELYYITGGQRFDLGYVDHPLLAPWLAAITTEVAGTSLRALRFWPAFGGAVSVLLAAGFARALGGHRRALVLAALATVACPLFFFSHTVFQTNLFDQLAWNGALLVLTIALVRSSKQGPEPFAARTWLWFGVLIGVGALAKFTIGVLGVALTLSLLAVRRREFSNPGLYLGGAVALLGFLPGALWQASHGFPFLEFAGNKEYWPPWAFVALLIGMVGPGSLPLVVMGQRKLFRQNTRLVGCTVLASVLLFLLLGTKPYYPNALFVPLFAAGAVALEGTRRKWPEVLLLLNLSVLPILMPVLPLHLFARIPDPIGELSETVGWEEFAQQVAESVNNLSASDRQGLVILTRNYGQAAALELLWPDQSPQPRPPVLSGQNSYAFWQAEALGDLRIQRVLALGYTKESLGSAFNRVIEVGLISNEWGVENAELNRPILFATGSRGAEQLDNLLRPHFD